MLFVFVLPLSRGAGWVVYGAYGGVLFCTALLGLRLVDGVRITFYDCCGALIALCGMLIIFVGWGRT